MSAAEPQAERRLLEAINGLLKAGRRDAALAQAQHAVDEGLRHPLPLRLIASARQQNGQFDEAEALFRASIALSPRDPGLRAALADCLAAARRPEAALEAWDEALALSPDHPSLLSGKAKVLQGLSRTREAAALLDQALRQDPRHPAAQFGLALLAIEGGDWPRAQQLVQSLRQAQPGRSDLGWMAAKIAVGRGDGETARKELTAVLRDPALSPAQRADSLLLLGEVLDGMGRKAEAFDTLVRGKGAQRRLYAERAASREGEIAKLTRLAEWFRAADPEPWRTAPAVAPVPDEADSHVFLVGFPRSGTTLLEQALAGHPQVCALEEAPTLAEPYARFMTRAEDLERLASLSQDEAQAWRARYWATVKAQGATAPGRLFLDKAPAGTLYLPLIAKLFPKARILFALRDPRDVVISCLSKNFQLNAMTYAFTSLEDAAACYGACMALARIYRERLPLAVMEVRHEALVASFDRELDQIARFIGLEAVPAMANIAATARRRAVRTPSAPQVRAGLNSRGVGRWRAYAAQIAPVLPVLAPWVEAFGYPEA